MGVHVSSEHHTHSLQLHGVAEKQHQLPGHLNDQRRAFLCRSDSLWRDGDVSCGSAALSPRQSLQVHLWLLCCVYNVLSLDYFSSSTWLADLLQQKAAGRLVHQHTREKEEIRDCWRVNVLSASRLCLCFLLLRAL